MTKRPRKSLIWNSGFALLDQALSVSGALIFSVLLARMLGPDGLGTYTFAITIASFITVVANLGTQTTLKRKVAERPILARFYVKITLISRWAISLPVTITVSVLGGWVLATTPDFMATQTFASLFIFASGLLLMFNGVLVSLHRNDIVLMMNVAVKIINIAIAVVVLAAGGSVSTLLMVLAAGNICFTAIIYRIVLQTAPELPQTSARQTWPMIKPMVIMSLPLMLAAFSEFTSLKIDTVFIGIFLNKTDLGLYAACFNFLLAASVAPMALTKVFFPNFIERLQTAHPAQAKMFLIKYVGLYCVYGMAVAGIFAALAPQILNFIYGSAFQVAAPVARILMWSLVFIVVGRLFSYVLVAGKRNTDFLILTLVGATGNIGLNLLLIPQYGLAGAAFATLITETVVMFIAAFLTYRLLKSIR